MSGVRGRFIVAGGALVLVVAAVLAIALATGPKPATLPKAITSVQGIDVSSLQHPGSAVVNWPDVAAAGNMFTAIKVSEATYYLNPYYAEDALQAAAAGLYIMPYAFANPFRGRKNGSAREQADAAVGRLSSAAVPASQMLPLALDIEPDPYAASEQTNQCYGLSRPAMVTWIRQFMAEVRLKTGKKPVIYTTTAWWKACTGNSAAFGDYPLWIAWYGRSKPVLPAGWRRYAFWQYSRWGSVPGITGSATDQDSLGPVPHGGMPLVKAQLQFLISLNDGA